MTALFFRRSHALALATSMISLCVLPEWGGAAVILVQDGRATALATDFTSAGTNATTGQGWTQVTDATSAGNHTNSRTGSFMQYLPDTGTGGSPTGGPFLTYEIMVTTPGEYQLYLSWEVNNSNSGTVGGSDSFFVSIAELSDGIGGVHPDWYEITQKEQTNDGDFNTTRWMSSGEAEVNLAGAASNPLLWTIATPGIYTLRFAPREDGVAIDQLVFQTSSMAAPTGFPPTTTVPEPGRAMLLGLGLMLLCLRRGR
ncbi:hypothetical protein FEM03_05630 [Phragmitibacter flavus]|uniref:Uncharacterized protein n=1 Tax=Phragmitibacter flavus TaxID=2576071 RepID=A0A5R8KHA2_9BACT|nr:hypothetical protein [Phragmitibacter flavus]TLD71621.1 hypothetical protein FEM03_05630 [Phragmitibacter flavus]